MKSIKPYPIYQYLKEITLRILHVFIAFLIFTCLNLEKGEDLLFLVLTPSFHFIHTDIGCIFLHPFQGITLPIYISFFFSIYLTLILLLFHFISFLLPTISHKYSNYLLKKMSYHIIYILIYSILYYHIGIPTILLIIQHDLPDYINWQPELASLLKLQLFFYLWLITNYISYHLLKHLPLLLLIKLRSFYYFFQLYLNLSIIPSELTAILFLVIQILLYEMILLIQIVKTQFIYSLTLFECN